MTEQPINPVVLVARETPEKVREVLRSVELAELKKLATSSRLATSNDMRGKSHDEVVELVQQRAELRLASRRPTA
ncbi:MULTISPECIES: hypothetical protein [Henriciella]|uniref:50S ribosomal protein L29 n=1 Tax=Henriciella pelagia TaxID=1977912 RepID=A0ABQ1JGM4_9PROT|nr:hypothetical protein [Henriciella pelagia]GGB67924.1 hypothetical protein GCM10011503_15750 [Henriciella pelagia]